MVGWDGGGEGAGIPGWLTNPLPLMRGVSGLTAQVPPENWLDTWAWLCISNLHGEEIPRQFLRTQSSRGNNPKHTLVAA